ncbi:replication initiator [Streptomyces sp. NPDC003697]
MSHCQLVDDGEVMSLRRMSPVRAGIASYARRSSACEEDDLQPDAVPDGFVQGHVAQAGVAGGLWYFEAVPGRDELIAIKEAELTSAGRLRLRKWAHMLGFRGHFSTKSRAYSVTLGALRQERADHNEALARERAAEGGHPLPDPDTVLVLSHWVFAGTGLTAAEHLITHGIPSPAASADDDTEGAPTWTTGATN